MNGQNSDWLLHLLLTVLAFLAFYLVAELWGAGHV